MAHTVCVSAVDKWLQKLWAVFSHFRKYDRIGWTEVGPEAAGGLTEEGSTSTAILMFTFLYHKIHDQLTTNVNL